MTSHPMTRLSSREPVAVPSVLPAGSIRSRRPVVRRFAGRLAPVALISLVGVLAGFAIGLCSFWADPRPAQDAEVWPWRLPELPAGIEPRYREQYEEAGAAVAQVLTACPESPDAVSALGVLCYLAHDVAGEQACWERCVALDPQNVFAYTRLFALAEQQADYQRIVDLVRQAEAANPDNLAYRGRLGSALLYLQRNEEAKAVLEPYVKSGRADADTYLVLGEVCFQLNDVRQAKRYFEAAAALAPDNTAMYYSLAKACAKLGEDDLAAEHRATFQRLKDVKTKEVKAEIRQGKSSQLQLAQDEVHIPIRIAEIMKHVGLAYQDAGELELAEQAWRRGVERNPGNSVLRELLSDLYLRQGRLTDTLECIRELQRLAPQNRLHDRNEGLILTRLQRYDEAEAVFRKLCRSAPVSSLGYAALAQLLLLRNGDLQEAVSLARRAVAFEPSGDNFHLLGLAAQQVGDLATARDAAQRALESDPDNPKYRSLHASIPPKQ